MIPDVYQMIPPEWVAFGYFARAFILVLAAITLLRKGGAKNIVGDLKHQEFSYGMAFRTSILLVGVCIFVLGVFDVFRYALLMSSL